MIAARPTLACLAVLLSMALGTSAAWADVGKRYALVIGNSSYENAEKLPNAARDATQIAQALSELRFEVFAGFNLSRLSFERLLSDFARQVDKSDADTVMIYYAGHGFELDGLNRLVPVDAALRDRSEIESETFLLDDIVASVQSSQRRTIIFLDACRDSPLPPDLQREHSRRGLAEMRTGDNTFVAFATQPGNVSYEGTGRNSPFTEALLTHIGRPGQSLSDMMIKVRRDVASRTLDRQVPWNQSSLREQFYFNPEMNVAMNDAQTSGQADGTASPRIQIGTPRESAEDEQTRSTDPTRRSPASDEQPVEEDREVQVASANADAGLGGSETAPADEPRANGGDEPVRVEDDVASLAPQTEPEPEPARSPDELVEPLQAKLQSIGCYRGAVDGVWGPLSRGAVKRFYKTKGKPVPSLQPSEELLVAVEQESGTVCKAPRKKAVAKKPPRRKARQPQHARRQPPPPPPPPHNYRGRRAGEFSPLEGLGGLGGGIGIGIGVGF